MIQTTVRAGVLLIAVCAGGCGRNAPETVITERAVPVTAEPVRTGAVRTSILATGVVEAAAGAELVVVAPEPAQVAELIVEQGDLVRRGDLLVRFEAPARIAEVMGRQAELDRAEARLSTARTADVRARDLFDRGLIPRNHVEEAGRELADAEAALAHARGVLNEATALADRFEVRATFDGIVVARYHEPGDLVQASAEDPVLKIVDPRRLEVSASIPLTEAAHLVLGARARVLGGFDETAEWLTVVSRPVAFDPSSTMAPVRLVCDADTKLISGTPVQLEIEGEERPDAVLVPRAALVRDGGEIVVFVAVQGRAERRAAVVGGADGGYVEVRSGVSAGELVITQGQAQLTDGAAVTVATAGR